MTRRLGRDDWLDHALAQLAKGGAEALKLAPICASAGVTRGSFYHHFNDHTAFLVAVAERWVSLSTDALIERMPPDLDAAARDALLTEFAMDIDFHAELGIRELARRIPAVTKVVRAADAKRLAFLAQIYADRFKITSDQAMIAAKLEYAAYTGLILIDSEIDKTAQLNMSKTYGEMMQAYFGKGALE
ncbi:TetR/AcrR family transcriptional regulator [Gymnodinialimonas sp. 2305UL16-5]|uniref:TetR/AcrR family transcriptional regulator n=1 Tax=Gymnodinialimonas mytili TaxID=3126503 RepID=UPI00309D09A5